MITQVLAFFVVATLSLANASSPPTPEIDDTPSSQCCVTYSNGTGRCYSCRARHLGKQEVATVTPDQVRQWCHHHETAVYETYLQVYGAHLLLAAKSEEHPECPNLIFHSNATMNKELVTFPEWVDDDSLFKLDEYPLDDLLRAYEQVESSNSSVWDIVTNNCATFVLDMSCYVGYNPTAAIFDWIVSRLVNTDDSTNVMMEVLRNSSHLADLPIAVDDSTLQDRQEDVVAELVYYYAAKNEGSCIHKKYSSSLEISQKESKKERRLTIVLVVETFVCMVLATICFWIGRSVGAKKVKPCPSNDPAWNSSKTLYSLGDGEVPSA